jgi:hypothetical protein
MASDAGHRQARDTQIVSHPQTLSKKATAQHGEDLTAGCCPTGSTPTIQSRSQRHTAVSATDQKRASGSRAQTAGRVGSRSRLGAGAGYSKDLDNMD